MLAGEQAGDSAAAAKELERGVVWAEENHCSDAAVWLLARAAQLHAKSLQWSEADAGYQKAVAKAQDLGGIRVETHLQMSWSEAFLQRGNTAESRQRLEGTLQLEEKHHPEGLGIVALLHRLGNVAVRQDHLDEADRLYQRACDLVLRSAPGSGGEAASASNLALTSGLRGDLALVERYAARALAIREKLTPSGEAIIPSLVNYGNVLYARGDHAGAEAALLRAKKILEKIQPESFELVTTLHIPPSRSSARLSAGSSRRMGRCIPFLSRRSPPAAVTWQSSSRSTLWPPRGFTKRSRRHARRSLQRQWSCLP